MTLPNDILLAFCAGLLAGAVAGVALVALLSPLFPLVVMSVVLIPLSIWFSHRPWHGPRKKGQWRKSLNALRVYFRAPRSNQAKTTLWGILIGLGLTIPPTTTFIWRS